MRHTHCIKQCLNNNAISRTMCVVELDLKQWKSVGFGSNICYRCRRSRNILMSVPSRSQTMNHRSKYTNACEGHVDSKELTTIDLLWLRHNACSLTIAIFVGATIKFQRGTRRRFNRQNSTDVCKTTPRQAYSTAHAQSRPACAVDVVMVMNKASHVIVLAGDWLEGLTLGMSASRHFRHNRFCGRQ